MQQGHVLGLRDRDVLVRRSLGQERGEVQCARFRVTVSIGQENEAQLGKASPDGCDLLPVQSPAGHQHAPRPETQSLLHRFGTKGRKERAEDAGILKRSQDRHVKVRAAAQQGENPFAPPDAELPQDRGEPVGLTGQLRISQ